MACAIIEMRPLTAVAAEICLLPVGVLNPVTSRYMPLVYSTNEEYMFAEHNTKEQSDPIDAQLAMLVQSKGRDDGKRLGRDVFPLRVGKNSSCR